MEIVLACFMQVTNLVPVAAHLDCSKFTNIRTRLRTNYCAYAHVVGDFSREVFLCVQI